MDVGSGTVFTVSHDFEISGTVPILWRRFYSSSSAVDSWLGRGWIVPWFQSLRRTPEGYELTNEEGSSVLFASPAPLRAGNSVLHAGANMELHREQNAFSILHWHHGAESVERFWFSAIESGSAPLAWSENLAGHRVVVHYDGAGRPVRMLQELEQRAIELTYNSSNLIERIDGVADDVRRRLAEYEFDTTRRLVSATDALGGRTSYRYDERGRMVAETNPLGSTFRFEYDERDRCVRAWGDAGYLERRLSYFTAPHMTQVVDSRGSVTEYYLNPNGQVRQEKSHFGAITTYEYDESGRLSSVKYADGGEEKFEYDSQGNRTAVEEGGSAIKIEYNQFHLASQITDGNGGVRKFEYDARGGLLAMENALGHRWTYRRDTRGLVTEVRTPGGLIVSHEYDTRLRWQQARDQFSMLDRIEYDPYGNEIAFYDAGGLVRTTSYDELDRPIEVLHSGGASVRCRWNAIGEIIERVGSAGEQEIWEYDRFGNLVAQTNPLGHVMRMEYDTEGKLNAVVNRAGERMEFGYDEAGQLIVERCFDGRLQRMEYDARGRCVRILKSDGRVISQRFDKRGRILGRETSDGLIEVFAWDDNDWLLMARNNDAVVELERNALGRVTAEIQNGRRVEYAYDADNNRVTRRLASIPGGELRMTYDLRGRLTSIGDSRGDFQFLKWDDLDRLVERGTASGIQERFRYDDARRLESQVVTRNDNRPIVSRRYSYDARDNVSSVEDERRGSVRFAHDELNRLTEVSRGRSRVEFYRYNPIGTILETHRGPREVLDAGRTAREDLRQLDYDDAGCIERIRSAVDTLDLKYDVDEKLVFASRVPGPPIRYSYDPLGRRIRRQVGEQTTEFLWEGCEPAAELNDGKTQTFFFMDREPIAHWRNLERLLPVTDRTGAVHEMLDEHGVVRWECSLDGYGNLISERGAPASPFRFRGQYHDRETGFHYNFFRSYDPRLGDFISPDPIGIAGGSNFYIYPRDPLNWDDPFGLKCNKHKGKRGEERMDGYYERRGYKRISNRDHPNGIDGVYHNPNGKPPYIIAEAKFGSSRLSRTQDGNRQMSDAWIDSPIAGNAPDRLERAVGQQKSQEIRAQAAQGNVGKELYHAPAGRPGDVVATGSYTGSGSAEHDMTRV